MLFDPLEDETLSKGALHLEEEMCTGANTIKNHISLLQTKGKEAHKQIGKRHASYAQ